LQRIRTTVDGWINTAWNKQSTQWQWTCLSYIVSKQWETQKYVHICEFDSLGGFG
jgi:hypothetical protein